MSNLPDKDFDQLFKDAAKGYETPFDEAAWDEMEQRLDAGNATFSYFKGLGVVIGAFIVGALLIWWYSPKSATLGSELYSNNNITERLTDKKPDVITDTKADEHPLLDVEKSISSGERHQHESEKDRDQNEEPNSNEATVYTKSATAIGTDPARNEGSSKKGSARTASDLSLNNESADEPTTSLTSDHYGRKEAENAEIRLSTDDNRTKPSDTKSSTVLLSGFEENAIEDQSGQKKSDRDRKGLSPLNLKPANQQSPEHLLNMGYLPYAFSLLERDLIGVEVVESGISSEDENGNSRFIAVKLAYSPDLTSVGYFKPDKPGSNFGLLLDYSWASRWSITSGAIYSKKIYFSEEQGSSYGYYGSSNSYSRVDGDCRVIDIPININYYIVQHANNGLYISAGASSYIMISEDYNFTNVSNGIKTESVQQLKGENNHFFSIINISLGYEQRIGNHLSLQLEPFIKAPLSGIGEGKVDLVSTGAFLNLKYKIIN